MKKKKRWTTEKDSDVQVFPGREAIARTLRRRVFFLGDCFMCGSAHHTQAFCPLARCSLCSMHGHTPSVCKARKRVVPAHVYKAVRYNE